MNKQNLKDAWHLFGPQPAVKPAPQSSVKPVAFVETARPTATRAVAGWLVAGPIGAIASLAFPKREKRQVKL
jgi:hypothetical protein